MLTEKLINEQKVEGVVPLHLLEGGVGPPLILDGLLKVDSKLEYTSNRQFSRKKLKSIIEQN